ncbi:hypothetical protein E24_00517 [Faustovirus]|nr:hypothetical protein PRJ_Fausto_00485 [Faustovirus]AMN83430.1 hypothetical protein E24_00517 [Faustovirus]AMN85401.1 hypothetical protein E23_00518 [Faustovirus]QBR98941.1 hypothetical protein [Faustovirus mariensis]
MQDVIKYNIIPLMPVEFLCVDRTTRKAALEGLVKIPHMTPYSDQYWLIVNLLYTYCDHKCIANFTSRWFDADLLTLWLTKVIRPFDTVNVYETWIVKKYFQFIGYMDDNNVNKMIHYLAEFVELGDCWYIYELVDDSKFIHNDNLCREIVNILNAEYYMSDKWGEAEDNCIKFAIKYFPNRVIRYIDECLIYAPPNANLACVNAVCRFAGGIVNQEVLTALYVRYRSDSRRLIKLNIY